MKYETFEDYYKRYPYKHTRAFNENEWEDHIYAIWQMKMKELTPTRLRRYVVTFKNGNTVPVQSTDYMAAKLDTMKAFKVRASEIESIL